MRVFLVPEEKNHLYKAVLPRELYDSDPVLISAAESNKAGDEKICGVLALMDYDNSWEIEYIYVEKAYRRRGAGTAMVRLAGEVALATVSDGLFVSYIRHKNEKALDDFFEGCGLMVSSESKLLAISLMDIPDEGILINTVKPPAKLLPLKQVSEREYAALAVQIRSDGEDSALKSDDLYMDIAGRRAYHPELSYVYYDRDGAPSGCVLISQKRHGLVVEYLYVKRGVAPALRMKAVISMLREAVYRASDELELGTAIYVNAVNPEAERILKMVSGDAVREYGVAVERIG